MKVLALFLAILLCLSLLACAPESAQSTSSEETVLWGQRVDEQVLISQPHPAQESQVSLISDYTRAFVTDYYFGKGQEVVKPENQLTKGPLHQNVTFSWVCAEDNIGFTLVYATDPDFSNAKTLETEQPQVEVPGLFTAATYYWQVITHTTAGDNYSPVFTFTTEDTVRIVSISGVVNVRDLGGYLTQDGKYRVRQGYIYRGGNLDGIDGDGMKTATQVYGIKTDLDLRSPGSESDGMMFTDKSPILMGDVNYINIAGQSYSSVLPFSSRMRDELRVFTQAENYPIYIHCKVGRDRTGTLAFILGALLGISEEKLLADFELTSLSDYAYAYGDLRGQDWMTEFLTAIKTNPGDTLQQKVENYCLGCGLTQEEIQTIRDVMLVPVN